MEGVYILALTKRSSPVSNHDSTDYILILKEKGALTMEWSDGYNYNQVIKFDVINMG